MRYNVVIVDERDLQSAEPESALMEGDNLEDCKDFLVEYLSDTAGIVRAFIEDTRDNNRHVFDWPKL